MTLDFLGEATNVALAGPNGVSKSMRARSIASQARSPVTPCCSPAPPSYSAISARSTARRHYAGAYAITLVGSC